MTEGSSAFVSTASSGTTVMARMTYRSIIPRRAKAGGRWKPLTISRTVGRTAMRCCRHCATRSSLRCGWLESCPIASIRLSREASPSRARRNAAVASKHVSRGLNMQYVNMHDVVFDGEAMGFPSLMGCHGIVYSTDVGMYGYHNYGGSATAKFKVRAELFAEFVNTHFLH